MTWATSDTTTMELDTDRAGHKKLFAAVKAITAQRRNCNTKKPKHNQAAIAAEMHYAALRLDDQGTERKETTTNHAILF